MESTEFVVTLTPYMMACGAVIMGVIQLLKDVPLINRYKDWLPFVPMVLAVIWAFADGWPKPILTGIVLGLNLTGVYKVVNAPAAAIEKKNNGGTVTP